MSPNIKILQENRLEKIPLNFVLQSTFSCSREWRIVFRRKDEHIGTIHLQKFLVVARCSSFVLKVTSRVVREKCETLNKHLSILKELFI